MLALDVRQVPVNSLLRLEALDSLRFSPPESHIRAVRVQNPMWEFPRIRGTLFGVLIVRILQFRVLKERPLFSETPIYFK